MPIPKWTRPIRRASTWVRRFSKYRVEGGGGGAGGRFYDYTARYKAVRDEYGRALWDNLSFLDEEEQEMRVGEDLLAEQGVIVPPVNCAE